MRLSAEKISWVLSEKIQNVVGQHLANTLERMNSAGG